VSGATDVLAGWEPGSFTAAGITHSTFRKGMGPGVVVVHEIPGITPLVTKFADEVVDAGFTVVMPSLLGTPGKEPSGPYIARSSLRLCKVPPCRERALHGLQSEVCTNRR